MTRTLDAAELDALFCGASSRIVRVEALGSYDATDDDPAELDAYRAEVRATVAAGVVWERLRVIDTPPTPYQRWELDAYLDNAAAGETIRVVTRGPEVDPDVDVWLFDDAAAAVMRYDQRGALVRIEAVDDPREVRALVAHTAAIRRRSLPLEDYLAASGPAAVGRAS